MSRSLKKGPSVDPKLAKKISLLKPGSSAVVKTWARACVITPQMVGFTLAIHNGKEHIPVFLVENMVGHRLGEFVLTRKFVRHGGKLQKEVEKPGAGASPSLIPAKKPTK